MQRREFLSGSLAVGAGLAVWNATATNAADSTEEPRPLNVAAIGAGVQGRSLINLALEMPGVRFRAVCDIWPFVQKSVQLYLEEYGHDINVYDDYRKMFEAETSLDAVLIASPDFVHAEQAIAALERGLHVYCEPMMSDSIEGARQMVGASRKSGKLLQIGYQRRSNPAYLHALNRLIRNPEAAGPITGRLVHFETQLQRRVSAEMTWAKRSALPEETLQSFGFPDMRQFRNWKNYRKFGQGNCIRSLAQQLDFMEWFYRIRPSRILAMGGTDYYTATECFDNVTAILEYPFPSGIVRGTARVWTTTGGSRCRIFEQAYGIDGSVRLSENPNWMHVFREPHAASWDDYVRRGDLRKEQTAAVGEDPNAIKVRETGQVVSYLVPVETEENPLAPHLRNFFSAIRGEEPLHCPAEAAFPAHVLAIKIAEAVERGWAIDLAESDWTV